jgi:hypothetical protein
MQSCATNQDFLYRSVLDYQLLFSHKRGHAVTQLVEALRYKPEGRGFDFSLA